MSSLFASIVHKQNHGVSAWGKSPARYSMIMLLGKDFAVQYRFLNLTEPFVSSYSLFEILEIVVDGSSCSVKILKTCQCFLSS